MTTETEEAYETVKRRKPVKTAKAQKAKALNGKVVRAKASNGKVVKAKTRKQKAPRGVDPSKLDKFGFRLTSKKHKAAAMYASKKGATLAEVRAALKSVQFNLLTELEGKGYEIQKTPVPGPSGRNVMRFHIVAHS